jgi:dihydrodipicolinate synthase/N-acetylneuraminate lyase
MQRTTAGTAALFRETNPAPIKYALSLFGLMLPRLRLPLVELADSKKPAVTAAVRHACERYSEQTDPRRPSTERHER